MSTESLTATIQGNTAVDNCCLICYLPLDMDPETLKQWEQELVAKVRELVADTRECNRKLTHVRALLSEPQPRSNGQGRDSQAQRAGEATYHFLGQHGRPASRREILKALQDHGIEFGGRDPLRTFAGMVLNRDPRFVPWGGRGMWGLAEWRQEEGN